MIKFSQGQLVLLKSDRNTSGAIIAVMEGSPENRYQVFTAAGIQTYYESQLIAADAQEEWEKVDSERFNAGITASKIILRLTIQRNHDQ